MPDPAALLQSAAMAGFFAAAALFACRWLRRCADRMPALGSIAAVAGILLGAWRIGVVPKWPPVEDLDRLLAALLPAAAAVEAASAWFRSTKLLRFAPWFPALAAAPWLLHGSVYMPWGASAPSAVWTPPFALVIFSALAAAAVAGRESAYGAAWRCGEWPVLLAFAAAIAAAALTILLSGYATGGQLGLPMSAALIGVMLAGLRASASPAANSAIGFGSLALGSLLLIGNRFANLALTNAVLLYAAPHALWAVEAITTGGRHRWIRPSLRIIAVCIPLALAVGMATMKFAAATARPEGASPAAQPSVDDYLRFQ